MTRAFDRDDDGYLDMDQFPDEEPDGAADLAFAPPPPLPDSDWLAALSHVVTVPDDAAATADLLDFGGQDDGGPDHDVAAALVPYGHDALLADDPSAGDPSGSGDDWSGSGDDWSDRGDDGSAGADDGHGFAAGGPDEPNSTGGSW